MVMNSFSFCVSGNIFTLPSVFKVIFTGYKNLSRQYYFISVFKDVASNLHYFQWKICCHLHFGTFFFFLSDCFKDFLYHWFWAVWLWCAPMWFSSWILCLGFHWASWIFGVLVFKKVWKFSSIISSKVFSVPFSLSRSLSDSLPVH